MLATLPAVQLGELRAYQGGHFRLLTPPGLTPADCALLDLTLPRGAEPQRQVHTREDHAFYLLDGEVSFRVGSETVVARPGQPVFVPRGVAHHFTIHTPAARLLVLLTPGRLAEHYLAYSGPLAAVRPVQGPPPFEVMMAMAYSLRSHYGVEFC